MVTVYKKYCDDSGVLIDGYRAASKIISSQRTLMEVIEEWFEYKDWDIALDKFAREYREIERLFDNYTELNLDNSQEKELLDGYHYACEWYEMVLAKYREQMQKLRVTNYKIQCLFYNKEYREIDDPELRDKNIVPTIDDLLSDLDLPEDVIEKMKLDFVRKHLKEKGI